MKTVVPWIISAFLLAFFLSQAYSYRTEELRQQRLSTIDGQTEMLAAWLELDDTQKQGYHDLRMAIVAKEKEFQDFRKKDAKEFWEANSDSMTADEKMNVIKERHLEFLKEIKSAELDLWSAWIDTLDFKQRQKYLGRVFMYRPLETSWYDRDFFDDI
jgi:hypothetical protein